jgi:DNA-binding PadR family transcriptional regulator
MLSTLELFILVLVHKGINMPYEIQVRAALSVGSTLPAFRRLLAQGLVEEAEPGPKGQRYFALTPAGKKELKNAKSHFDRLKRGPAGDLESTLRLASLAFVSGNHKLASEVLLRAAVECDARSVRAQTMLKEHLVEQDIENLYQGLLDGCEADRQKATAKRLRAFAVELQSGTAKQDKAVPTGSPNRRRSGTKGLS